MEIPESCFALGSMYFVTRFVGLGHEFGLYGCDDYCVLSSNPRLLCQGQVLFHFLKFLDTLHSEYLSAHVITQEQSFNRENTEVRVTARESETHNAASKNTPPNTMPYESPLQGKKKSPNRVIYRKRIYKVDCFRLHTSPVWCCIPYSNTL